MTEPLKEAVQKVLRVFKRKGKWWKENFEVHSTNVSEPLVADNWFSVKFEMDTTHKPSGNAVNDLRNCRLRS